MRATDEDLERMFKLGQEHSVGAAVRAIYERGVTDGMALLADGLVANAATESVEPQVSNPQGAVVSVADTGDQGQANVTAPGDGTVVTSTDPATGGDQSPPPSEGGTPD